MKRYFLAALLLFSGLSTMAQTNKYPIPSDVATLSGIISAAYDAISGEKGSPRQLERIKSLYAAPGIISKNSVINGIQDREVMGIDAFHQRFAKLREYDFYEEEINREVRIFGSIATVWSTYQIRQTKDGPIFSRGINCLQLHYKNKRWWILSWSWDVEREGNVIPRTFDSY
ncbi:MAG: hypothetical protein AAFU64_09925 [Bacteroidota bacterium]